MYWAPAGMRAGVIVAVQALAGLADLMRLLTRPTPPAVVLEHLVRGPLADVSTTAGILMQGAGDELVMVGSYGYAPGDIVGFETMPVAADLPICRAYREGEPVVTSIVVVEDHYPDIATDPHRWDEFRERAPRGSIVSVPLLSQGVAIGCLGFTCSEERDWGPASLGLLDCVSSAVAMWLAHPISGLAPEQPWTAVEPITLTARQREVLRLVASGQSTVEIASSLAYSESTVKQEMRRLMRLFTTGDRATLVRRARSLGFVSGSAS